MSEKPGRVRRFLSKAPLEEHRARIDTKLKTLVAA